MAFGPSLRELSLLLLLLCSFFTHTISWRQWNYSVTSTTSSEVWLTQWSKATGEDIKKIPRPRRGHSLVLAGDYLVMFGGRGNEAEMVHIPRTYNVQKVPDPFPSLTFISLSLLLCLSVSVLPSILCLSSSSTVGRRSDHLHDLRGQAGPVLSECNPR
jgi:hypothetical protein